jgi:hypothetical protein
MSAPKAIHTTGLSSEAKSTIEQREASMQIGDSEALEFRQALRGGLLIAAFAVGLLFLGWMAFYFLIFMARGYVG